ncbi:similar to Saccharomyces cerevisiae YBR281C DUG2 Probable di- and tri-peptidase [Maudiozyma barnettii]|uniref:Similar to Saccharomyces cerevisiae YBR281C DUG2 Probable di- and tri-peptidase n=1 Tax=Maudiozyma barnettii TaxID=61262 RepID=A0A8H2VFD3_9SACH|nr:glutamine amidotransferase subunit DUG2 [Kazachstania barnettii]CAB4254561.1 similar to Saccharomyces cerevisiae YBR281C DUG2 Probable di- and tri-peptidase [Kazachstania barnettii]CAD1782603.1 similar to Saccharomyces cerevisiae YBR281C DUG2 Probable di- and tri-peptidase [Kazachstania barnettii]
MSDSLELVHKWSHTYSILSTCAFPHKKLLFAGTQDSKILVFDTVTYNLIKILHLGQSIEVNTRSSVLCLDKSKDENSLFSAGADSLVRIWSIGEVTNTVDTDVEVNELVTIYSVTDIGDIFSIRFIDSLETLVFGCQNASLLYLDNVFKRLKGVLSSAESNANRLPHRRYNKFFDSNGPTGSASPFLPMESSIEKLSLDENLEILTNTILEIPSNNIVNYAHNGFIYSICELDSQFKDLLESDCSGCPPVKDATICEYIITGSGDGTTKIWVFVGDENNDVALYFCKMLDCEDSVLSQDVEFPFLYCGLGDGAVKIWDLSTNQSVSTLSTPVKSDIISLSVYNDCIYAANESGITLFQKGEVELINTHQGKILSSGIFERIGPNGKVYPNLLTGGNDGSLTLWNLSCLACGKDLNLTHLEENWSDSKQTQKVNTENMLNTLKDLTAFETVSQVTDGTSFGLSSRRCATYLQQLFATLGASQSRLLPISDSLNPAIVATFTGNEKNNDKRRILWYGHYDVIHPGDRDRWNTDPSILTCENGYMKGRGVSDNKGPLVSAIHSVAMLHKQNKLENDVVFLIEGNEEIGSPGFAEVCKKYKNIIGEQIDWIMLSNSTWVDTVHPCLNYGLRGVINARVTVYSDVPDSHSGVNGGILQEPTTDIIRIISKLQNDDDSIRIPNFYDNVKDIDQEELIRFSEISEMAEMEKNGSTEELIKNWTKPSLSLTTLCTSGPGNITVIPRSASIGMSIRLVPGQSVDSVKENLQQYVKDCFEKLSSSNHLKVKILNVAEPWLGDPKNDAYQILKEEITKAWNMQPLFVREGGSIPCIRTLERIFEAPAVQIPCGQSTDNCHLYNENLRIKNFSNMAEILYNVINRL